MAEKLALFAVLKAQPEHVETLHERLAAFVGPSRKEPGCLEYRLMASDDSPGTFSFFEVYESKEAFRHHVSQPYMQDYDTRIVSLLAEPVSIRFFAELPESETAGIFS